MQNISAVLYLVSAVLFESDGMFRSLSEYQAWRYRQDDQTGGTV